MKEFEFKIVNKITGRLRTITISAYTLTEARYKAFRFTSPNDKIY